MSSSPKIPAELYYLDPSFSLRSARKYQLMDILASNGVTEFDGITISESLQRQQLMQAFKEHILTRKKDIIQEYNRKEIEEYLGSEAEGEDDEELSEENNLSENDEREAISQSISNGYDDGESYVYRVSTGKRVVNETPEKLYPTLDDQGLNSEMMENDTPMNGSHVMSLRSQNRRRPVDDDSDEDADFMPDYYELDDEESESESDEDLDGISKNELYLLRTDQNKPPETYDKPRFHMVTRARKMAFKEKQSLLWKRRGLLLFGALIAIFAIMLSTSIQQRNQNGYCQNYPVALESNRTGLFHLLSPCIPCPAHGICKNSELICEALYERRTPFYNMGNMFPVADECVHNSVLGRYVGRVERNMKKILAVHQGNVVCEYLIAHPNHSEELPVSKIPVNDLIAKIRSEEQDRLPENRIDEIMGLALNAVVEDPHTHVDEVDGERIIGIENPKFTFACGVKSRYHNLSFKTKLGLLVLFIFTLPVYGALSDYKHGKAYKKQIDKLAKETISRLKEQAQKHAQDRSISPTISVPDLRAISIDVNDRQTIKDWEQVLKQIMVNPHIRKSFQEVRGDPVEFWELIA